MIFRSFRGWSRFGSGRGWLRLDNWISTEQLAEAPLPVGLNGEGEFDGVGHLYGDGNEDQSSN